jgi:hypothetical protein
LRGSICGNTLATKYGHVIMAGWFLPTDGQPTHTVAFNTAEPTTTFVEMRQLVQEMTRETDAEGGPLRPLGLGEDPALPCEE